MVETSKIVTAKLKEIWQTTSIPAVSSQRIQMKILSYYNKYKKVLRNRDKLAALKEMPHVNLL